MSGATELGPAFSASKIVREDPGTLERIDAAEEECPRCKASVSIFGAEYHCHACGMLWRPGDQSIDFELED